MCVCSGSYAESPVALGAGQSLTLYSKRGDVVIGIVDAFLMILPTALEDRALKAELPGYGDYALQARHRLVPGTWQHALRGIHPTGPSLAQQRSDAEMNRGRLTTRCSPLRFAPGMLPQTHRDFVRDPGRTPGPSADPAGVLKVGGVLPAELRGNGWSVARAAAAAEPNRWAALHIRPLQLKRDELSPC